MPRYRHALDGGDGGLRAHKYTLKDLVARLLFQDTTEGNAPVQPSPPHLHRADIIAHLVDVASLAAEVNLYAGGHGHAGKWRSRSARH